MYILFVCICEIYYRNAGDFCIYKHPGICSFHHLTSLPIVVHGIEVLQTLPSHWLKISIFYTYDYIPETGCIEIFLGMSRDCIISKATYLLDTFFHILHISVWEYTIVLLSTPLHNEGEYRNNKHTYTHTTITTIPISSSIWDNLENM